MGKLFLVTIFLFLCSTAYENYDGSVIKDVSKPAVRGYHKISSNMNTSVSLIKKIQEQQKMLDEQLEVIETIKQEISNIKLLRNQVEEMI